LRREPDAMKAFTVHVTAMDVKHQDKGNRSSEDHVNG